MAAKFTTFDHISALEGHRGLILVSIPIFAGSRNPMKQLVTDLSILNFFYRGRFPKWPPELRLLTIFQLWKLIET